MMNESPWTPDADPLLPKPSIPLDRPAHADPDLPGTARMVAKAIEVLVAQTEALNTRLDKEFITRLNAGAQALKRTKIALGFIAAIILVVGFLLYQLSSVVATNRSYIRESCVLYEVLLSGASPAAREKSTMGPEGYDMAIAKIRRSAERLNCPSR